MKSLFQPHRFEELTRRLDSLRPGSPREWGRMTPNGAVCHLTDAFKGILGERVRQANADGPRFDTLKNRTIGRLYALTLPLPWPKGVPTSPAADQEQDGTPPADFDDDVAGLRAAMERFRDRDGRDVPPTSPLGTYPGASGADGRTGTWTTT